MPFGVTSIAPLTELPIRLLARACESSALLARAIRAARFKGRCRVVSAMRRVPIPRELTADCGGVRFHLDLRDDVQRGIYFGCYEPRDLALIAPLIRHGAVCIDVGANVGFYALHLARLAGEGGRVVAFEPDPRNLALLKRNIALNRSGAAVEVVEAAVSDREGSATLHRSDDAHSGWGSLAAHADEAGSVEVRTTTLDAFLERRGIRLVDFIKIDVEGSEIALLRGAERSLEARRFRRLLIEFNGVRLKERGETLGDFLEPLETAGYRAAAPHAPLVDRMKRGVVRPETVWPNLLFEPA